MPASVSFTGIQSTTGADFPLARGIAPSICTLYMVPQEVLDLPPGILQFADDTNTVAFSGCAIEAAHFHILREGRQWRWSIQILDRRRTWKQSTISGEYNVRKPDGSLVSDTQKSAQELMGLCLTACGEIGFDASQAPQNVFPYVRWRDARADLELAWLCEYTACEVCPTVGDTFAICALGTGGDLQSIAVQKHPPVRYVPRSTPSTLRVVGGPSIWQTKLKLQPVAEEADGTQAKLEDASYKPSAGWTYESPVSFPNVTDDDDQRAALETAYRRFRVLEQAEGGLTVPGCPEQIDAIDQYLPLLPYLVESANDLDLTPRAKFPFIEGDYWPYSDSGEGVDHERFIGPFTILHDRGEVEFLNPVLNLSSGTIVDPTLYLTCAYRVIGQDGDFVRVRRERGLVGGGGVELLRRPELFATFLAAYDGVSRTGLTDTLAAAEQEADAYLDRFAQKYAAPSAGECTYAGILPVAPDGNLSQVTWRVGSKHKPQTHVCLHEELDVFAVDPRERKRREQLERLVRA